MYLITVPKFLKVACDNQFSVYNAANVQPAKIHFELVLGKECINGITIAKSYISPWIKDRGFLVKKTGTIILGQTCNVTLTIPDKFPLGTGQLTVIGTGDLRFQEKRHIIVYDNRYVIRVQTSTSIYRPGDMMQIRVVGTNEELIPIENDEVLIEISVYLDLVFFEIMNTIICLFSNSGMLI